MAELPDWAFFPLSLSINASDTIFLKKKKKDVKKCPYIAKRNLFLVTPETVKNSFIVSLRDGSLFVVNCLLVQMQVK